ncbi:MAG: pseudouridine synthase [Chloroflexi bacterium]|nr:pseudouridine synthase [Chloroflexota bacterium]MCY3939390.1 pseudouridine synthase [Chloroflexota bacterium]
MPPDETESSPIRLHVFLAHAGKGSRRAMEAAVAAGRVSVNGKPVTVQGTRIDPAVDSVTLDGRPVEPRRGKLEYIAVNKPRGVMTTARDERGRKTVLDLLPTELRESRVYPVGRLDRHSEGLVLLTNDGELTHRLLHPSFEHEREYVLEVTGRPSERAIARLRSGIELQDGPTNPARFDIIGGGPDGARVRAILKEGRNRQLRRMFAAVGHSVIRLKRVRIGPIQLGSLKPGESRRLTAAEIAALPDLDRSGGRG